MDEDFPDYDYRSSAAQRRKARDARILRRIALSRDFHFIFGVLRATHPELFLPWAVHALERLEGAEALKNEAMRQCKKEPNGQKKPIPAEALRARQLMNKENLSRSSAVQAVIGPGTRDKYYKDIYNILQNRQQELDELLQVFPETTLPERIKAAPGLEIEKAMVFRAAKGRLKHKASKRP